MTARFWTWKTLLLQRGRVTLLFEPRDIWLGYFHGKDAGYVVIVPCLPLRIAWKANA